MNDRMRVIGADTGMLGILFEFDTKVPLNPCLGYGHCKVCVEGRKMICCECGDALSPWHPDIQFLCTNGALK